MDNLPQIVKSVVEGIKTFINTIVEHLPEILQAGVQIIIELARGLIEAIPELVAAIPEIIMSIVGALLDPENIAKIFDAGLEMIGELFDGLLSGDFLGALADIGKALLGAVGAALGAVFEIGAEIVNGIWEGMKSVWNSVESWFIGEVESMTAQASAFEESVGVIVDPNGTTGTKKASSGSKANNTSAGSSADHYTRMYNTTNNTYINGRRVDSTTYNSNAMIAMKSGGK